MERSRFPNGIHSSDSRHVGHFPVAYADQSGIMPGMQPFVHRSTGSFAAVRSYLPTLVGRSATMLPGPPGGTRTRVGKGVAVPLAHPGVAAARRPGAFAAGISAARLRIALRNAPLGSNPGIRTIGSPNPVTRVKGRYECDHGRRPAFSQTRVGSRHVGRGVARTWSPALRVPLVSRERGNGNRRPSIHRHTGSEPHLLSPVRSDIPGNTRKRESPGWIATKSPTGLEREGNRCASPVDFSDPRICRYSSILSSIVSVMFS